MPSTDAAAASVWHSCAFPDGTEPSSPLANRMEQQMSAQAGQADRSTMRVRGGSTRSAAAEGYARPAGRPMRTSASAPSAVSATTAALARLRRLQALHGSLAFVQSGGRAVGQVPMCLREHEAPLGPNDIRIGEIGGAPFYVDAEQYERWQRPAFLIDVAHGATEGFSLDAVDEEELHFITRTV